MSMDRNEICRLIPHGGAMCLLDEVLDWTPEDIHCRSRSHLLADHPLRLSGRLHALHGIEYGAQAAAVHGGLLAAKQGSEAPPGLIAALKHVELLRDALDESTELLEVRATRLLEMNDNRIYRFEVAAGDTPIVRGRITIMAART